MMQLVYDLNQPCDCQLTFLSVSINVFVVWDGRILDIEEDDSGIVKKSSFLKTYFSIFIYVLIDRLNQLCSNLV